MAVSEVKGQCGGFIGVGGVGDVCSLGSQDWGFWDGDLGLGVVATRFIGSSSEV